MKQKIAVSVASLMPGSLGKGGPDYVQRIAEKTNLGLHLLPLEGWNTTNIWHIAENQVHSYEDVAAVRRFTDVSTPRKILCTLLWYLRHEHLAGVPRYDVVPEHCMQQFARRFPNAHNLANGLQPTWFRPTSQLELVGFLAGHWECGIDPSSTEVIIEVPPHYLWPMPEKILCRIRDRICEELRN